MLSTGLHFASESTLQQKLLRQFVWALSALTVLRRGAREAHGRMPRWQR